MRADTGAIAGRLIAAYEARPRSRRSRRAIPISMLLPGTTSCAKSKPAASRRLEAGRSQDRVHEPDDLAALRRLPADVGACLGAHGASRDRDRAALALAPFVQPRIEPEVVFKLKSPLPVTDDALAALDSVEWIAPGFEIVQSHFPNWKFAAADCTAAFGLHGALVIGTPLAVTDRNRAALAAALPGFALTLRRAGAVIDTGVGANVLDSPALALVHLARVLARQPQFPPLTAGEIITTGTITDAWPVAPGETWTSDYGALGLPGLTLAFR